MIDIDVAIVDLRLSDGSVGDLIKELRAVNPSAHALPHRGAAAGPSSRSRAD